jgi:hypothetical protein
MNWYVFLSILAMDSYQRGYAPGITELRAAVSKNGPALPHP